MTQQAAQRLDLRILVSRPTPVATRSPSLRFGARGDLERAEPFRRLREAQFVAIVTPSVKPITAKLARGA